MLQLRFRKCEDSKGEAHLLLEELLREACGISSPVFSRTGGGKPVLQGGEFHFNLSHSGSFALCGVGDRPLGVDVERIRPRREGLPRYALSDLEFQWYTGRGGRWEDFYTLWTLKESYVKYTGEGLTGAVRAISVPLLSPGESGRHRGLWFRAYGGEDWRAACCGEEEPPELKL